MVCSRAIALSLIMTIMAFSPIVLAFDTDGDGVDDSTDDCPLAWGNSTVDRDGCPDKDGDGTSDVADPWVIQAGGFLEDNVQTSSVDYYTSLFNHDGSKYLTTEESGWLRIWSTATQANLKSVNTNGIYGADWSPDGMFVAVTTSADELEVYYSSNVTPLFTVSTAADDGDAPHELAYSPDGTMIAVVIGRSGNGGTDGEVQIYNSLNGSEITSFEAGTEDEFYSVDWSPDGSRILIGGPEDVWIYETSGWTLNRTINTNRGRNNAVAWSPDGNTIATCEEYESSGARVRLYGVASGLQNWYYATSTSCNDVEYSPDGTQVAASMRYYQSDGAKVRIFKVDASSDTIVDTLDASSGDNGEINSIDWHPDGDYIISAHGRNDEGIYHWIVDPDIDNDGVLNADDAFPEDATQWDDTDNDGYGDNPAPATDPDACPTVSGTSTEDRFGCPDTDGDGWSDANDAYPSDGEQWSDADGDGYPDNTADTRDPNPHGSIDWFPNNPTQWDDSDLDGYGDNFANASWIGIRPAEWPGQLMTMTAAEMEDIDTFPLNIEQWNDTDGDWIGDEPFTTVSDGCIYIYGNSVWDRLACYDTDGDGWSDPDSNWPACIGGVGTGDAYINDATQWCDSDGDGYGDNQSGTNGDDCPGFGGNSTMDKNGCKDSDGDGYSDVGEYLFRNDPTQWFDADGDGCGDNLAGNNPDLFPDDVTQCGDRDGDGFGDYPTGVNGDWFPDEITQWYDFDLDHYGDNYANASWVFDRNQSWPGIFVENAFEPDICPMMYGTMIHENNRGCPDSDGDNISDNLDAFPDDPFQSLDLDGDGFGDDPLAPHKDDCPHVVGNSTEGNTYGCPDSDGDGWADTRDDFPNEPTQWEDSDNDSYGDNWGNSTWNETRELTWPGIFIINAEMADAFPNDATQWSDSDGDGWGDNPNGTNPDDFPFIPSQYKDSDGDGYGDNTTRDAYQPDECRSKYGTSYVDRFGCTDYDGDGTSDDADHCMYDSNVWEAPGVCEQTEPDDDSVAAEKMSVAQIATWTLGILVSLLLLSILIAMISRQAAKRSGQLMRQNLALQEQIFEEEDDRRQQWVDYYVGQGNLEKAKELGWVEKAEWQLHEEEKEQQAVEEIESLPEALDLDDIL